MDDDRDPREVYGHATLRPTDDVVAASFGTWRLTYTVGAIGMDDGSRLKLATNVSSDWGRPQFDDPAGDNYSTVETSGDATVEASVDHHGHVRPMKDTISIDVSDGALDEGETIIVTFGDRSEGSMGLQMQSFPEQDFEFLVLLDAFETGEFVEVAGDLTLDIVGGPANRLQAVAPSHATPGDEVTVSVRAEDYWGNVAERYGESLSLSTEDGAIDETVAASDGIARTTVTVDEPGVYRIDVSDQTGRSATTNPIVVEDALPDRPTYWGDIHGQSGETVGTGTIQEYFTFARDSAFLDFASHAGNDFQITDDFWAEIQETIQDFHDPEAFVTFLCYEWSSNTPNGGDHNVYFRDDEAEIHRSSSWQVNEGLDRHEGTWPAEALYDRYAGRDDVMIIPHQGGRPATLDAVDPELTPFVEILSVWGIFEWFGQEALERGLGVGFVAGSDDHTGRLGASYPTNETDWAFPIKGGIMAAKTPELTRDALWTAFNDRRVYGTTGARILLDVDVAGAEMGASTSVDGTVTVDVDVHGTAPIESIEVIGLDEVVAEQSFLEGNDLIEVSWTGARSRDRHKVQDWSGGLSLDAGRITDVEPFGFEHPNQGIVDQADTSLRWDGSTAGNVQGIRLGIDDPGDATLAVNTETASATVSLDELDDSVTVDAGGIERELRIRRTGASTTLDTSVSFDIETPLDGTTPVYVRVRQTDGEVAWSSPVFVEHAE